MSKKNDRQNCYYVCRRIQDDRLFFDYLLIILLIKIKIRYISHEIKEKFKNKIRSQIIEKTVHRFFTECLSVYSSCYSCSLTVLSLSSGASLRFFPNSSFESSSTSTRSYESRFNCLTFECSFSSSF